MIFLALLAAVLTALAFYRPRGPRRGARNLAYVAAFSAILVLAPTITALWYYHRPQPPPRREALFQGISYQRDVRLSPRPIVTHVVAIDLRNPSISFFVSPPDPAEGHDLRGWTTSQFLLRHDVQLAINGDFFLPWYSNGPHDFYPRPGDPVDALGVGVSDGRVYGRRVVPFSSLVFAENGAVSIIETIDAEAPFPPARQAISGKMIIVRDGARTAVTQAADQLSARHPRTAAALDRSGNTLLLFAVDGRQPGYSEGVSLDDLATIVIDHGGFLAMNLDGGGSTAIAITDGEGGTRLLNCPIHTRVPWRERTVANHLGVRALPLAP